MMPLVCETSVSRKGNCPLRSCSIANDMCGSMELSKSWKVVTKDFFKMANIYICRQRTVRMILAAFVLLV